MNLKFVYLSKNMPTGHCEHVPTLGNMMLTYVVQNYKEWEPPEIPQHQAVDLNKLKYTVKRFTRI